jgi:hypothetical protein
MYSQARTQWRLRDVGCGPCGRQREGGRGREGWTGVDADGVDRYVGADGSDKYRYVGTDGSGRYGYVGTDVSGGYWYVGADTMAGIVMWAQMRLQRKLWIRSSILTAGPHFKGGGNFFSYIDSFT